jgi:chromatin segregation and condensation protein Rec8/ScpA/Scc1 (kleisin family)
VFSSLVEDRSVLGVMQCLIPLLHLANKVSVALQQDAVFGEIFVHLTEGIAALLQTRSSLRLRCS